ncbi:MAG: hypothetical protein ACI4IR_04055 [Eubacterium sp.]
MSFNFSELFSSSDFNINNPKLEEMINKTRDVAESVGKKSAERLELSKMKIESLDLKAKLSKQFEKYGELQYNSFIGKKVDASEIENIASSIAVLKEKLNLLNEQIEEAKASFNDIVSDVAQKTKDAFHKETTVSADEVEVVEAQEQTVETPEGD